jgi:hypothetical protein
MKVYVAASLLAMLIGSSAQAAFATDNHDPNIDRMFHGRREAQVVDESMIINRIAKPPQGPTYAIDGSLPASQAPQTIHIQVGAPGGVPGGTVMVGPNSLPFAGPTSNMSSLQAPSSRLPNGGLANHVQTATQAQLMNRGRSQGHSASAGGPLAVHAPTGVAAYAPEPASGAGRSYKGATTDTHLTLRNRGDLIQSK